MLGLPALKNARDSTAGLLPHAHEAKHLVQIAVAAIGFAAMERNLQRNTHQARIAKTKHIRTLDHQNRSTV